MARPFVLCETRPEMTVGNVRPLGVGVGVAPCSEPSAAPDAGPFSLDGCELTVCAASGVLSSERGTFVWFNILKPGISTLVFGGHETRIAVRFVIDLT